MPGDEQQGNGPPRGSVRSTFLLLVGVGIIIYEARWAQTDRPWLYGVALVMMGLISPEVILSLAELVGVRRGGGSGK